MQLENPIKNAKNKKSTFKHLLFVVLSFGNPWLPLVIKDHDKALTFFGINKIQSRFATQMIFLTYSIVSVGAIILARIFKKVETFEATGGVVFFIVFAFLMNKFILFAFRD